MLAGLAAIGSGLASQAVTELVLTAIVFHLAVLVIFKFGAFLVLSLLETEDKGHRLEDLSWVSTKRSTRSRFDVLIHAIISRCPSFVRIPVKVFDD